MPRASMSESSFPLVGYHPLHSSEIGHSHTRWLPFLHTGQDIQEPLLRHQGHKAPVAPLDR